MSKGRRPLLAPDAAVWLLARAVVYLAAELEARWVKAFSAEMIVGTISLSETNGRMSVPTVKSSPRTVVRLPGSTSTVSPAATPLNVKIRTSQVVRNRPMLFCTSNVPSGNWYGFDGDRFAE